MTATDTPQALRERAEQLDAERWREAKRRNELLEKLAKAKTRLQQIEINDPLPDPHTLPEVAAAHAAWRAACDRADKFVCYEQMPSHQRVSGPDSNGRYIPIAGVFESKQKEAEKIREAVHETKRAYSAAFDAGARQLQAEANRRPNRAPLREEIAQLEAELGLPSPTAL